MAGKTLKVGIISKEDYKKRSIAIAKGKYSPKGSEPKVWFESLQSMAQVLSNENRELLKIIIDVKPDSIRELEEISGRKSSNLSRTLKMLARYGIVELKKQKKSVKPIVKATDFKVEFGLDLHYA